MNQIKKFLFKFRKDGSSGARNGFIHTPHGIIKTPAFIFCATKGAVKGVSTKQLEKCGTQIILSNTYHMMLCPGKERMDQIGGLHKMTGWKKPMLTDSGGFQIFSLGYGSVAKEIKKKQLSSMHKTLISIDDKGAVFKSYINGKKYYLSPEESIKIQKSLGADIILVLDECTPYNVDKAYTENAMKRSHDWCLQSLKTYNDIVDANKQKLYGIIQGGVYKDLRKISSNFINENNFFGNAIGGSLGKNKEEMEEIISYTTENLSQDKPVHLLGIGRIKDIFTSIRYGIDTFDCVYPTRLARHGGALIKPEEWKGKSQHNKEYLNLNNSCFALDSLPISEHCDCDTCENFTRSYLHHLLKAKEIIALQAITIHNIAFMNRMMSDIRVSLNNGTLNDEEKKYVYR